MCNIFILSEGRGFCLPKVVERRAAVCMLHLYILRLKTIENHVILIIIEFVDVNGHEFGMERRD